MTQPKSFGDLGQANQSNPEPLVVVNDPPPKFIKFDPVQHWYEVKPGRFWFQIEGNQWVSLSHKEFTAHLNACYGFSKYGIQGAPSQCAQAIEFLLQHRSVDSVTDLAGYFGPCVIKHCDSKILIKHSPRLIVPIEGDYPTILCFLSGMLQGEQDEHLNCWTALSAQDLYDHRISSSIIPAFCGPHSCGKSLLQLLLTQVFGGRSSRPYSVMTGATQFNAHLHAAEHLVIEDEYAMGDLKSRNQLGTACKNFVANQEKLHHGKGQTPFMLPALWQRMTASLNDETENVAQLPQRHPSLDHKMSLYDCSWAIMPMPTHTAALRAIFWAQLMKELPAWIYDLLYRTSIPEKWKDDRFGIKAFRHDKVVKALDELQPEIKLLELIDVCYFGVDSNAALTLQFSPNGAKTGTATEIESGLRHKDSPVKAQADDLLHGQANIGRYLTRLLEHPSKRISFRHGDRRLYTIKPPLPTPADSSQ